MNNTDSKAKENFIRYMDDYEDRIGGIIPVSAAMDEGKKYGYTTREVLSMFAEVCRRRNFRNK